MEDIDFCKRLKFLNKKIYLLESAEAFHLGGKSHNPKLNFKMELERNWHFMWSLYYFNKKHYGKFFAIKVTLKKFITSVVSNECIIYMLVPYEGEISCQMPTQIFEHLFDLEDDGIGFLDNYNNVNPELQQDYDTINEILSLTNDDYQETIIPEKELSLDEILEKITNKGIESLTKKEKQTLHQYSK